MKTITGKSFIYSSFGFVLTLCFTIAAAGQGPVITNRLETGGNYQIAPPPTNMMFQITANAANAGDDNLVWSHSGKMLATDRTYSSPDGPGGGKYICLLDVRNLGNVQTIGARTSAATNPVFANITGWTWNDDRILFGWQPQVQVEIGDPPIPGKVRLMSCTSTGAVSVVPFLEAEPQGDPTNHVYSPSVVFDQTANKERLLFLVSSSTNNDSMGVTDISAQPAARINLYTVLFDSGGVPNWNESVQLTDFNTNLSISSVRWCPELGTNYQPIANRLVILFTGPDKLVVLDNVQDIIANSTPVPTNLYDDTRFVVVEINCTMSSQVSWTFDGQYVMYGRLGGATADLYSMRADSSTNIAVKFEIPSGIADGNKQWLCISPDGMKAAFAISGQLYVIPLQFDNAAVTGAVVTNVLTDASYTAVDVKGDAIPSNTTFSIVAPPSVDTNNFKGEFSGYAREFSVSGVSSQFDLATNAEMTLHFSQSDIPSGASITNLAIYVYNPQGTNAGQTGSWDKLDSVIDTNKQTITCEAEHFSIYAIGRASDQPEPEPEPVVTAMALAADFDGDAKADPAVYNTNGNWKIKLSNANYTMIPLTGFLGGSGYTALAADFDGDAKADPAIYSAELALWAVKLSSLNYLAPTIIQNFGGTGWAALAEDFDGDAKADPAIYQASTGTWKIMLSGANYLTITKPDFMGSSGWTAIAADFDGDGKVDPTIYKASTGSWIVMLSKAGYILAVLETGFLGSTGYTGIGADFDGDGLADPTVAQTSTGNWEIRLSNAGYIKIPLAGFLGE